MRSLPLTRTRPARSLTLAALVLSAAAAAVGPSALASPGGLTSAAAHHDTAPVALAAAVPRAGAAAAGISDGGITPAGLHAAYGLPTRGAAHQTIAVLSAFKDPQAESDLSAYSKRFGLPACTTANHCLRIINQNGQAAPLPSPDLSGGQWITESGLGLQVAHAVCQSCSLILVEANAPDKGDLAYGAAAAAAAGATVIETAATPREDPSDDEFAAVGFDNNPAAIVAAAGDPDSGNFGYTGALNFPSSLSNVIAVGGTHLTLSRSGGYGHETAWSGTVTGCSLYHGAPAWQTADAKKSGCGTFRAVADVSAVADPGALVHLTGTGVPGGPWYVASGTSLASPVIAGVIGLAGSTGSAEAQMLYARAQSQPATFHDIRSGANSASCSSPLCRAVRGYDPPTGLGTPSGLGAFLKDGGVLSQSHPKLALSVPGTWKLNRGWSGRLSLRNSNAFGVSGVLTLARMNGKRQITLATARLKLDSLAGGSVQFTVARSQRAELSRLHRVVVYAQLRVAGPAGHKVNVRRRVGILHAP